MASWGARPDIAALAEPLESRFCLAVIDFAPFVSYAVGNGAAAIASADFNGDGLPDLATANVGDNSVSVLLNSGSGAFAAAVNYPVGQQPQGIAVGDFNDDGHTDLVVANAAANTVSVLSGNGDGTFGPAVHLAVGTFPSAVAAGDFNADGIADIAVTNQTSRTVGILISRGDGTFDVPVNYAVGWNPRAIATADLNNDGKLDVVAGNQLTSNVSVLIGAGTGSFAAAVNYSSNAYPVSLAVADYDEDGLRDIGSVNYTLSSISILRNAGGGTFAAPVSSESAASPNALTAADFDQDGHMDLAVGSASANFVTEVFRGNGDGTFAPRLSFSVGASVGGIVSGDFNADGKPDLAVTGSSAVRVLLSPSAAVPVVANAGGPYTVAEGASATLSAAASTGSGLSYAWDLDGDGIYGETGAAATRGNETGVSPTFLTAGLDGPSAVTVSLRVTDSASQTSTASATVNITNVAPTIALSGNATANEGAAYNLTLGSITDPGTDTVTTWIVDWGDGKVRTYNSGGVKNHPYSDGPFTATITVTLVDEDGQHNNVASKTVTVVNVAPTLTISGNDSATEGAVYTLSLTSSDSGDDTIASWTINWGDGNTEPVAGNPASITHIYRDNGTYTISASASDEDGSFAANSKTVTVTNVAPTISLSGNASVNEGATYSLTLGSITDPGADTVTSWIVNWGDGSSNTYASGGVKTHTYADGPLTANIAVTLVDEDGSHAGAGAKTVTVANVAPTLTISGSASVAEGASYTLNLSATDPGVETIGSWVIDWGDGSSQPFVGNPSSVTHVYADNGAYTITASAADEDGPFAANSKTVTVTNVAPTISLSGNASVNEGATYSLTLGAITDPGADTVTSWIVNWGDGSSNTYASGGVKTHTYADGPLTANIAVTLVDEDGTHATAGTRTVSVQNVAPTLTISGAGTVRKGVEYRLTLAASDPGVDTRGPWSINWGDGSTQSVAAGTTSATHTYTSAGTFSVRASANDEDGTFNSNSLSVVVTLAGGPTLMISGDASSPEGSAYTLNLSASSPVDHWIIDWGDLEVESVAGSLASVTHTYRDDGTYAISAFATDANGTYAANTKELAVINVAPRISLDGEGSVNEGAAYSLTLGPITDPGADTVTAWIIDWGDGSSSTCYSPGVKTHVYADGPFIANITVTLVDEDGQHADAGFLKIGIDNVAPTISLAGHATVHESVEYTLYLGAVTDPGTDRVYSWLVNWGDGSADVYTNAGAKTHTYADGPLAARITVALADEDGVYLEAAAHSLAVNDVPPTLRISGEPTVYDGLPHTVHLSATDVGADGIIYWTVNWGDGTLEAVPAGVLAASHRYAAPGVYTIAAAAMNEDGIFQANFQPVSIVPAIPAAAVNTWAGPIERQPVYLFTVLYSDAIGLAASTLDNYDMLVTGPNGYSQYGQLVAMMEEAQGRTVTATYQVPAPSGAWSFRDNGLYTIGMVLDQVTNVAGRSVPVGALTSFVVSFVQSDLAPPVAGQLAAEQQVTGGSPDLSFRVTYTDETALSDAGIGGGNVLVSGPNGYAQLASLVSAATSDDRLAATAIYRITAPGGFWDPTDNGVYTFELQANQVSDEAGNFAAARVLGVAVAKLAPDNIGTTAKTATPVRLPADGRARTFSGYVMGGNTQDYLRFVTYNAFKLTAHLTGLVDRAQVQVLDSRGKIIPNGTRKTAGGTYFVSKLPAGKYMVRVVLTGTSGTGYKLTLAALPLTTAALARAKAIAAAPLAAPVTSSVLGRDYADLFNRERVIG